MRAPKPTAKRTGSALCLRALCDNTELQLYLASLQHHYCATASGALLLWGAYPVRYRLACHAYAHLARGCADVP